MATVLGNEIAYMIYTKSDNKLYGMEISTTECYPDRDEILLMDLSAGEEYSLAKIVVPPTNNADNSISVGTGILKIIAMKKSSSSSSVHTVEYF